MQLFSVWKRGLLYGGVEKAAEDKKDMAVLCLNYKIEDGGACRHCKALVWGIAEKKETGKGQPQSRRGKGYRATIGKQKEGEWTTLPERGPRSWGRGKRTPRKEKEMDCPK